MAPGEPPNNITVRVKVPPGHVPGSSVDEYTLGVLPASSRIGDLRQQIQQLLPSHPSPDRQRLLYAGRALVDNDQTLAAVFNTRRDTTQNEYVLHLLVRGDQDAAGVQPVPGRMAAGLSRGGAGLLNSTPLQEQGSNVRAAPQPSDAVPQGPQGLPQLPQVIQQPPYSLQHAQHLALLQQRQAQQQIAQHMQQLGLQQRSASMGIPQMQPGRPVVGIPQGNLHHPLQFAPGQLPQQQDVPMGNQATPNQINSPEAGGDAPANTARPEGTTDSDTQAAQSNGAQGQQPQPPHRPVSGQGFHVQGVGPDGNRFEIHQQTLNIPFPGQPGQFGLPVPGMGLPFPLPGMAQQQRQQRQPTPAQQGNGPSALDRARQNVAEMRQMVDAMRTDNATEEDRARTARLQEHIQAVNDYIDPFGVGRPTARSRSASPFPARMAQSMRASPSLGLGPFVPPPRPQPSSMMPSLPSLSQHARQQPMPPSNSDATCYLLSSPQGPHALLFSPQHGTYTGSFATSSATGLHIGAGHSVGLRHVRRSSRASTQPAPTPTGNDGAANGQQAQGAGAPADPAAVAAALQAARQINPAQQARPQAQDNPLGPMQPLLGHFWLLLRVMIFAYFILGTNMGWRRPLALAFIGLGFWMLRAGLFGEGGVARRWWDGIVRVDQRHPQQPRAEGAAGANGEQRPGQLPTPEELAQRLIEERQQALDRAPLHRIREQLRPVERAAALFFASFWPGVGEAHVRAREAEERRLMEEEVERRRREEEEAQRAIEAQQEGEKQDDGGEKSPETAVAGESGEKSAVERDVSAAIGEDTKVSAETGSAGAEATLSAASEQVEQ
jgi:hypothetical protein